MVFGPEAAQCLLYVHDKMEVLTQKVTSEVGAKGWDKALKGKEEIEFLTLLRDLDVLRKIKIPRYISHVEGQLKESTLLMLLLMRQLMRSMLLLI
jgi:hypothetical protein